MIWDFKNYESLITYEEDFYLSKMIVTKNNDIITTTKNSRVNV
jgi:hypothetical protein